MWILEEFGGREGGIFGMEKNFSRKIALTIDIFCANLTIFGSNLCLMGNALAKDASRPAP